jgi:hypothetical protein
MKKVLLLGVMIMLLAAVAYAQDEPPMQCGGFTVVVAHTAPGEGTFDITGENDYGTVDVSGTFKVTVDKETKSWSCVVTFDEGSTIVKADGEVIDLSGKELYFSSDQRGQKRIVYQVVQYIKSLLEGA